METSIRYKLLCGLVKTIGVNKMPDKEAYRVMGVLLWKKQKVSILHDYHYKHVEKTDIPAYTRQMGIGLIIIGSGIIITGLFNLAYSSFWWIPLSAGFIIGSVADLILPDYSVETICCL